MLVDSHCHLDRLNLEKYQGELELALQAAKEQDVSYILCVCVELEELPNILKIAEQYEHIWASVGLHPTEERPEPSEEQLIKLAAHPRIIAIGETGLDYYRCEADAVDWQRERFRTHIRAAKASNKALIIHTRQAQADTIQILTEENARDVGGVMHCFTESWEMAKQALDLGFYISFSGIVTFNNAKVLQEVAKKVPLERMLIETDAPYLAPVPMRGKPNEPAYVKYVAQFLADLKAVSYLKLAEQTTKNFFDVFKVQA